MDNLLCVSDDLHSSVTLVNAHSQLSLNTVSRPTPTPTSGASCPPALLAKTVFTWGMLRFVLSPALSARNTLVLFGVAQCLHSLVLLVGYAWPATGSWPPWRLIHFRSNIWGIKWKEMYPSSFMQTQFSDKLCGFYLEFEFVQFHFISFCLIFVCYVQYELSIIRRITFFFCFPPLNTTPWSGVAGQGVRLTLVESCGNPVGGQGGAGTPSDTPEITLTAPLMPQPPGPEKKGKGGVPAEGFFLGCPILGCVSLRAARGQASPASQTRQRRAEKVGPPAVCCTPSSHF